MNTINQNKPQKGFSLVEILVALGIVAIIAALIMNTYKGIQNSAIAVAQQKDQAELNQVMAELRMSGGSLAAIVNDTAIPNWEQAAEITYVLQNTISSQQKTQKGTVGGDTLTTTEYLIPYPYSSTVAGVPSTVMATPDNGTTPRIVFSSTGVPSISTTVGQPGFIAINTATSNDYTAFGTIIGQRNMIKYKNFIAIGGPDTSAVTGTSTSLAGTKYAGTQAYVWDEDTTPVSGPTTVGGNGTAAGYTLSYAYAYSAGGTAGGSPTEDGGTSGNFNLAEYLGTEIKSGGVTYDPANYNTVTKKGTAATVYVFAYLSKDGKVIDNTASTDDQNFANGLSFSSVPTVGDLSVDFTTNSLFQPYTAGALSSFSSGGTIDGTIQQNLITSSNSKITANTIGALMTLQLCAYDPIGKTFLNGLSPTQWSNGTMSVTTQVSGVPSNTDAQTAVAQFSATPVTIDSFGAPSVPTGAVWDAVTNSLDLTGVAAGTTVSFNLPPTGTAADYGDGNFYTSAVDSSTGITLSSENSDGVTYSYTAPSN